MQPIQSGIEEETGSDRRERKDPRVSIPCATLPLYPPWHRQVCMYIVILWESLLSSALHAP